MISNLSIGLQNEVGGIWNLCKYVHRDHAVISNEFGFLLYI